MIVIAYLVIFIGFASGSPPIQAVKFAVNINTNNILVKSIGLRACILP